VTWNKEKIDTLGAKGLPNFSHGFEHNDDQMIKLEVNLDDISGEWLGYLMDKLLELGVNDVYYTPIYMKKNRPAILLSVLSAKALLNSVKSCIFKETTTLGVRYFPISAHRLERRFRKLQTEWGGISIKEGIFNGEIVQAAPEYEECKKIAETNNIPLKKVFQEVWKLM
jgi:pyridinium-3,5-bisthiocarboxylic acid mononucleotide nickel chelatase